jgi:hypothetical protein
VDLSGGQATGEVLGSGAEMHQRSTSLVASTGEVGLQGRAGE